MTETNTLKDLYNTHLGNVSDKWSSYLEKYEEVFSSYRDAPVRVFEIGVQNGGSLEIWSEYFQNAELILGCDINPKCAAISYDNDRIKLILGDIKDPTTLHKVQSASEEMDIIIDDGSHLSGDIINTFCKLFPKLSLGGTYVVEDLHCSYWKQFEGGLNHPKSSISFFKALIDILNHEHWGLDIPRRKHLDEFSIPDELSETVLADLHSVAFSNSMCIIQKKEQASNVLGQRRVVGRREVVSPVLHVAGTYNQAPLQDANTGTDAHVYEAHLQDLIKTQQDRIAALEEQLLNFRIEPTTK